MTEAEAGRIAQKEPGPVMTCPDVGVGNPASSDQDHRASASSLAFVVVVADIVEDAIVAAVADVVDAGVAVAAVVVVADPAWQGTIVDSDVDSHRKKKGRASGTMDVHPSLSVMRIHPWGTAGHHDRMRVVGHLPHQYSDHRAIRKMGTYRKPRHACWYVMAGRMTAAAEPESIWSGSYPVSARRCMALWTVDFESVSWRWKLYLYQHPSHILEGM